MEEKIDKKNAKINEIFEKIRLLNCKRKDCLEKIFEAKLAMQRRSSNLNARDGFTRENKGKRCQSISVVTAQDESNSQFEENEEELISYPRIIQKKLSLGKIRQISNLFTAVSGLSCSPNKHSGCQKPIYIPSFSEIHSRVRNNRDTIKSSQKKARAYKQDIDETSNRNLSKRSIIRRVRDESCSNHHQADASIFQNLEKRSLIAIKSTIEKRLLEMDHEDLQEPIAIQVSRDLPPLPKKHCLDKMETVDEELTKIELNCSSSSEFEHKDSVLETTPSDREINELIKHYYPSDIS